MSALLMLALIGSVYATMQSSYTYTGCLANSSTSKISKGTIYNVKPGTSPISACRTGDYQISLYDKIEVDSLINSLTNQIASLSDKTANIENNMENKSFSATFLSWAWDTGTGICTPTDCTKDIISNEFYLPVESYVYVSSSGNIGIATVPYRFGFVIDDGQDHNNSHSFYLQSADKFSLSDGYKLSAGNHIIHLKGYTTVSIGIPEVNLIVIATEKGSTKCNACSFYK